MLGDTQAALDSLEAALPLLEGRGSTEKIWMRGLRSRLLLEAGQPEKALAEAGEALELIRRTVELGEPKSIQALAYFEMGELLAELGRCEEALDAFLHVRMVDQTGGGPLVERAQWRYDELRFVGPRRDEGTAGC